MTADVVIAGGGVIGSSIAAHLAAGGASVTVLDRSALPGAGSTGRATGGFRTQFGTAVNIALSRLSREKLLTFHDETGVDPGYDPRGYLFLASSQETLDSLRLLVAFQQSLGVSSEIVSHPDAVTLSPHAAPATHLGGSWCADDGFIRPLNILAGYRALAERRGVRFVHECEVQGTSSRKGRISSVKTTAGEYAGDVYVNALGAWAGSGVLGEVPVVAKKRQVAATIATSVIPAGTPMTIYLDDGFHFRVRDGRVLLLMPHDTTGEDLVDEVSPAFAEDVARIARERIPILRDIPIEPEASWAGLYEMTEDHHSILGRHPWIENLWLANGSSGHGVMHSPAIGQIVAELINGRPTAVDVSQLNPSRFAEAKPVAGSSLL